MTDRTVKVRIAVAVDEDGDVATCIVDHSMDDYDAIQDASRGMFNPVVSFIEADVYAPPPPGTIPATVTKAEDGE